MSGRPQTCHHHSNFYLVTVSELQAPFFWDGENGVLRGTVLTRCLQWARHWGRGSSTPTCCCTKAPRGTNLGTDFRMQSETRPRIVHCAQLNSCPSTIYWWVKNFRTDLHQPRPKPVFIHAAVCLLSAGLSITASVWRWLHCRCSVTTSWHLVEGVSHLCHIRFQNQLLLKSWDLDKNFINTFVEKDYIKSSYPPIIV